MYKGPRLSEIIAVASRENKKVTIENLKELTLLKVSFITAYNSSVADIYYFNSDKELFKQELGINKNLKVVFDKYEEVKGILDKIPSNRVIAS